MVLFDSRSILPTGNVNYSLVGVTPEQATTDKLGIVDGVFDAVPSVDADIDACNELIDEERVTCWAELDQKLMEEVVPWVPYLDATNVDIISDAVLNYQFDQFSGEMGYAHVAVDQEKQSGV